MHTHTKTIPWHHRGNFITHFFAKLQFHYCKKKETDKSREGKKSEWKK